MTNNFPSQSVIGMTVPDQAGNNSNEKLTVRIFQSSAVELITWHHFCFVGDLTDVFTPKRNQSYAVAKMIASSYHFSCVTQTVGELMAPPRLD
jgi:hypothetical protein